MPTIRLSLYLFIGYSPYITVGFGSEICALYPEPEIIIPDFDLLVVTWMLHECCTKMQKKKPIETAIHSFLWALNFSGLGLAVPQRAVQSLTNTMIAKQRMSQAPTRTHAVIACMIYQESEISVQGRSTSAMIHSSFSEISNTP